MIRARAGRVTVEHANFIERLEASADASLDRYILLDAQDWMNDEVLTRLWTRDHPHRAARRPRALPHRGAAQPVAGPCSRRICWTAGITALKIRWAITARDRSSIYGGVHLYVLR